MGSDMPPFHVPRSLLEAGKFVYVGKDFQMSNSLKSEQSIKEIRYRVRSRKAVSPFFLFPTSP